METGTRCRGGGGAQMKNPGITPSQHEHQGRLTGKWARLRGWGCSMRGLKRGRVAVGNTGGGHMGGKGSVPCRPMHKLPFDAMRGERGGEEQGDV
eukprot:762026-Hanusia_phi.AAC.5